MDVIFDAKLLTPEQIRGAACGVCGFSYESEFLPFGKAGRESVPIGYAKGDQTIIVMACADKCAQRAETFDKLFATITEDDLRLAIGYIEVNNMELLLEAFEHVIALKKSGATAQIDKIREHSAKASQS